jgi:ABC-type glycerol-3-phosphate transport system permease component
VSPTIRSRLAASAAAFLLGFVLANYGILRVAGPDRWLWLAFAIVLMVTGAIGVIISDSPRRVSVWSVVGLELMIVFTLTPLLWMFSIAVSPDLETPTSMLPQRVEWSAFGEALGDADLRGALLNSLLVSFVATLISFVIAIPAAHTLIRQRGKLASRIYLGVVTLILAPLIVFQGAIAEQLRAFGLIGLPLAAVIPMLLLTVPLATWLCVSVLRDVPWTLRDAIRVEGASTGDEFRRFVVPIIGPGLLVAAFITFVVALNDFAVGAVMMSSQSTRLLPATMIFATGGTGGAGDSAVMALALLLLLPWLAVMLAVPRKILLLLGRTYR